jgi:hypothetical protein
MRGFKPDVDSDVTDDGVNAKAPARKRPRKTQEEDQDDGRERVIESDVSHGVSSEAGASIWLRRAPSDSSRG